MSIFLTIKAEDHNEVAYNQAHIVSVTRQNNEITVRMLQSSATYTHSSITLSNEDVARVVFQFLTTHTNISCSYDTRAK